MLVLDSYLYLVMAMMLDCPVAPVTIDEQSELTEVAYDARSDSIANTKFESISMTKCITHWEGDNPERTPRREEFINFYGTFPHITTTDSYRERYSIKCYRSVYYDDKSIIDQKDSCTEELERFMRYEGLNQEVQLRGVISIDDATSFLDYLMQYEFGKLKQVRMDDMLRKTKWVQHDREIGYLRFRAFFPQSCTTTIFESTVVREHKLRFGKVDVLKSVC